jgi:hypothetical protein
MRTWHFCFYDETDEKAILERRVVSIVIGSKVTVQTRKERKTSGVTKNRPLSLGGFSSSGSESRAWGVYM